MPKYMGCMQHYFTIIPIALQILLEAALDQVVLKFCAKDGPQVAY